MRRVNDLILNALGFVLALVLSAVMLISYGVVIVYEKVVSE